MKGDQFKGTLFGNQNQYDLAMDLIRIRDVKWADSILNIVPISCLVSN